MRQGWFAAAMTAAMAMVGAPSYAQRAAENAVDAAEDAFGVSVGNERVGLYSSTSARGFNPTQAGNIRMEGLYFDQQNNATGRIYADTTMRVGLSAQSFPFPAPTGIADTRLRRPGDHVTGSATATFGPYESLQLDLEVGTPIIAGKLGGYATLSVIDATVDYQASYLQYTYGGVLNWTPNDNVNILVFDQGQFGHAQVQSFVFTPGGVLPPEYDRRVFFGQPWTEHHRKVNQLGFVMSADVFGDWDLKTGFFRSRHRMPDEHFTFFRNVQPDGFGTLDILRSAVIYDISYSGEARLTRTFTEGKRQHTFHFAVRGRDAKHLFGGGASYSFGPAQVGVYDPRPEPVFGPLADPSLNHVSQYTPGVSYVGRWLDVGEFSVGLQKSFFRGDVTVPGIAPAHTESQPWLYNSTLAVYLSKNAALYGSYTRGLEESGVAPENASNRGQALPVSLTQQIDAGVRYKLAPGVTLIAGVFEVKKPYFDRNAANFFTGIGNLNHRGIELSLSGQVAPGLTVIAGAMLLRARVEASAIAASFIGSIPTGRPNRNVRLNVQYGPSTWRGFSIDGQLNHDGPTFANRANTVPLDANTTLDLGARYIFNVFDTSASLRVRVLNVANTYGWTVSSSGWYTPIGPRRFTAQLVADF